MASVRDIISFTEKFLRSKSMPVPLPLGLASFCNFWQIFFLHVCLLWRKFPVAAITLFLEPKVKALQQACRL
jgi:hypothetical protein